MTKVCPSCSGEFKVCYELRNHYHHCPKCIKRFHQVLASSRRFNRKHRQAA